MRRFGALLAAGLLAGTLAACGGPATQEMESAQAFAMDTVMVLTAGGGETGTALQTSQGELYRLDRELSRTREDSAVSRLNSAPAGTAEDVGEGLYGLIAQALTFSAATDGAFDITLAPVSSAWGFTEDAYRVPGQEELDALLTHVGADHVHLEGGTSVSLDQGTQIDLGAIAKGYAVEQVCRAAPDGLLLSVGGNVRATGPKPGGENWVVGIQAPGGESGAFLHTLYVRDVSVVTSGDYQRYYTVGGVRYHHIIDPTTCRPAAYWRAVTVLCADSGLADALSTALFTLPQAEGQALLDRYGAEAMWVDASGGEVFSPGFSAYLRT